MTFNNFCNICFIKENIIKLCWEENEPILNILISFSSCQDIVNDIIYLCINCCNRLEEYRNFRELYLMNFVRFRYLYYEHKKQLEISNAPDMEIKLKAFVQVNVERESGTPLIENCDAAQALRNDTLSNVDITYKKEADEFSKIDLNDLLNKNESSHSDIPFNPENSTLQNDTKIYIKKYENDSFQENQENNGNSIFARETDTLRTIKVSRQELFFVTKGKLSERASNIFRLFEEYVFTKTGCPYELLENDKQWIRKLMYDFRSKWKKVQRREDLFFKKYKDWLSTCVSFTIRSIAKTPVQKVDPNPDLFDESKNQLVNDAVPKASPCNESADSDTSDVSFIPEGYVTDDSTDEEGSAHSEIKKTTSDIVCNVCDENFLCNSDLDVHMRTHTGAKHYNCNTCHKTFTDTAKLRIHEGSHKNKKFICDECGYRCTLRSNLNIHKRIHTGERPYKCDECGLTFRQRTDQNKHKRIHTGEKPFKCDECGSGFTQRSNLNQHKLIHTGEKPYKCEVCGLGFTQQSTLKKHKVLHTGEKPYKCDECGSEFTQQYSLKEHKYIHTGEKPYKCDECGSAFRKRSNLNSHKLIHTGEKPYKCDECGLRFTKRSSLNRHKHTHQRNTMQT